MPRKKKPSLMCAICGKTSGKARDFTEGACLAYVKHMYHLVQPESAEAFEPTTATPYCRQCQQAVQALEKWNPPRDALPMYYDQVHVSCVLVIK
jgi:hypothetical protein